MSPRATIHQLRSLLIRRAQLLDSGSSDRDIQAAVTTGRLLRLYPGIYVSKKEFEELSRGEQHLLHALCTHSSVSDRPVFSHFTAGTLLGLPMLSFDTGRAHILEPTFSNRQSSPQLVRHRRGLVRDDYEEGEGLLHTTLMRTVVDMARDTSFENGVVFGDAAIRLMVRSGVGEVEECRSALLRLLRNRPSRRGQRRALRVICFLSDSADSPLESLFRLQLARLGFEVKAQVAVPNPWGGWYYMDLELVGYGTFLEADGRVKYLDPSMRHGRTLEQLLLDEKTREDYVRGSQNKRVVRGGWEAGKSPQAMERHLRALNVPMPADFGHRARLDLY